MAQRSHTRGGLHGPDPDAALSQYEQRADRYDYELVPFEPIRCAAVDALALQPGETVVDVGCGTGLSLGLLGAAVGSRGRVLGVEPSPAMLARAAARLQRLNMPWIEVQQARADAVDLSGTGPVDAMLFHFTHDVLRDPKAVGRLMRQMKPGGRVAAAGLQWAPFWAVPANLFVWTAALYSTTCLEGLSAPWDSLSPYLEDIEVRAIWGGAVYLASGRRAG